MSAAQMTLTRDEILCIQTLPLKVIIAAANGQIDLNAMARDELACRGLDQSGK